MSSSRVSFEARRRRHDHAVQFTGLEQRLHDAILRSKPSDVKALLDQVSMEGALSQGAQLHLEQTVDIQPLSDRVVSA